MEITELRVGNWARRDYLPDGFQIDVNSFIVCDRDPEMYQPIPLTEEWLLKFGFELFPWGWVFGGILVRWNIKDKYWIELGNGQRIEIPFVHTLQNFFVLTGTELEMK
jgi:hypothetical protein